MKRLLIIQSSIILSRVQVEQICSAWETHSAGTDMENTKLVYLPEEVSLVDMDGNSIMDTVEFVEGSEWEFTVSNDYDLSTTRGCATMKLRND